LKGSEKAWFRVVHYKRLFNNATTLFSQQGEVETNVAIFEPGKSLVEKLAGIMSLSWWAICILSILIIFILIVVVLLYRRIKRFEASYLSLQTFMNGQQLDIILNEYIHKVSELDKNLEKCNMRLTPIELKLRASIDRAELLRFRAFEDVGSDLSFAFALLNQEGDGVVLSSIHNRDETRIYAKPVNGGQSMYLLSDEEKEVISKAIIGQKI